MVVGELWVYQVRSLVEVGTLSPPLGPCHLQAVLGEATDERENLMIMLVINCFVWAIVLWLSVAVVLVVRGRDTSAEACCRVVMWIIACVVLLYLRGCLQPV